MYRLLAVMVMVRRSIRILRKTHFEGCLPACGREGKNARSPDNFQRCWTNDLRASLKAIHTRWLGVARAARIGQCVWYLKDSSEAFGFAAHKRACGDSQRLRLTRCL